MSDGGTVPTNLPDGSTIMTLPDGAVVATLPDGAVVPVPPPPTDGGSIGQIRCGASMCNAATQVCCATGNGMPMCTDPGQCKGTSLACTGPANCSTGEECCYDGVSLSATCAVDGTCGVIVCAENSDCPQGEACQGGGGRGGRGGLRLCLPGGGFDGGFPPPRDGGGFPHDGGRGPADTGAGG